MKNIIYRPKPNILGYLHDVKIVPLFPTTIRKVETVYQTNIYIYLLHILQQLLIYTLITYLIVFLTSSDQVIKFKTVSKL